MKMPASDEQTMSSAMILPAQFGRNGLFEMYQMAGDAHMSDVMDDGADPYMMTDLSLPFDLDLNAMSELEPRDSTSLSPGQRQQNSLRSVDDEDGPETDLTNGRTVVGAGPLPTSYGMQLASGVGSTLTEFTKRRNWSHRVIEEIKDFLHILTPDGRFLYVSPSAESITGHEPQHLLGKLISEYIHPEDNSMFIREFNESIASGNPLRFFYRFRRPDETYTIFESHGHPHLGSEATSFGPNCGASFCRGFFMMARPYPTKNASLLDSFLEHKIENERLKKRIADLKREEKEDLEGPPHNWSKQPGARPSLSYSESQDMSDQTPTATPFSANPQSYSGMPPPSKPSPTSPALTRQNLDEVLAASRPDSINDKMARYEGATHIETIEMLTGLRYRDGERSKGISTGASSPKLIRGDAGIAILVDEDGKPAQSSKYIGSPYGDFGDKKKKTKVADEYVCTDCGTLDSPEWRKGPSGPKTLCNACGLRWAKKEKKRNGALSGSMSGPASGAGSQASAPLNSVQQPTAQQLFAQSQQNQPQPT